MIITNLKEKSVNVLTNLINAIKAVDTDVLTDIENFINRPKKRTYKWDSKVAKRKSGYKQNRRKGINVPHIARYGSKTDSKDIQAVLDMGVDYIKKNGITSRGELRRRNNSLYMAMYHRNLLDKIPVSL